MTTIFDGREALLLGRVGIPGVNFPARQPPAGAAPDGAASSTIAALAAGHADVTRQEIR